MDCGNDVDSREVGRNSIKNDGVQDCDINIIRNNICLTIFLSYYHTQKKELRPR